MSLHKTSAGPLGLAYAILIVYASLYPFDGWRAQGLAPWAFMASPWPRWWTGFDLAVNVFAYVPLGYLLALAMGAGKTLVGIAAACTVGIFIDVMIWLKKHLSVAACGRRAVISSTPHVARSICCFLIGPIAA
mgnify:CR=1 FL=1